MSFIDLAYIQQFKPISSNIDATKKVNTFIQEAQEFEIRPIVGDQLYLELFVQNPSFIGDNAKLMNGTIYTYDGKQYAHSGLKTVHAYYAYARYLNNSNNNQTAFGTVIKTNPDSEPVSEKTIARLVSQAVSGAKAYEAQVVDYLKRNSELFPLFECVKENRRTGGLRITPVR